MKKCPCFQLPNHTVVCLNNVMRFLELTCYYFTSVWPNFSTHKDKKSIPKPTNFDMLVSPVDEPLVNLIAEAESVVFNAEVCNHLEFLSGENLQSEDRNDCQWFNFPPTCANRLTPKTAGSMTTLRSPFRVDCWGC